jgi:hypothetical protein
MRRILLACAASAAFSMAAPAQEMPKLSLFLGNCFRDSNVCRMKLKDYIRASDTQHIICRPEDMSLNEASGDMLRWLRDKSTKDGAFGETPIDDAFYQASIALWPCQPPPEPPAAPPPAAPPPPAPPPPEQPAAPEPPATPQ